MADDRFLCEIVTNFMINTCKQSQRLNVDSSHSIACCAAFENRDSSDHDDIVAIPQITGSNAEFRIQPMLSCVGDVDIMIHFSHMLAIPAGEMPPTQLPGEFTSRVLVYDIIDSGFHGYVYLVRSYWLTECTDDENYNAVQCSRVYLSDDLPVIATGVTHGPAVVSEWKFLPGSIGPISGSHNTQDTVPCVRCLVWPPQAAGWPTRQRNYGWPDSAAVDRVVRNGCDLVSVAHRLCRQDEWMNTHQRRLSFSRAEIVLINSWMREQQIVYHMLRFFVKTEHLTESADDSEEAAFSNYHIKTLMLWACELKPRSWWIDDVNLIRICVDLLHILGVWLTIARCPHYFIDDCNLLSGFEENSHTRQLTARYLLSVTEAWLAEWFINNYIHKCAQSERCPDDVSRLFDDISTREKLENAVSTLVYWRSFALPFESREALNVAKLSIWTSVSHCPLTVSSCVCRMREIAIDQQARLHFTVFAFLHVALKISGMPITDELLDVLATLCLQSNDIRRCHRARHSSKLSLSQAAKLMNFVATNSRSTVLLIEIELSKAYLFRALKFKDSDSDSINCLANVYLAVLYCATGQYQTAINHCTRVTRSQCHSQCRSCVVQGELLPQIDDEIDSVLGLAVFYQFVQKAALKQHQTQYVSAFSTELFAHYLRMRCLSVAGCCQLADISISAEIRQHKKCLCESTELFTTDVLAFRLADEKKLLVTENQTQTVTSSHFDTSDLVELLQQSAVEYLTTCRQFEAQEFASFCTIVTTDYEALYAYKRGNYQRCLQLSAQNVRTLLGGRIPFAFIYAFPEFIQLMDDEIVSLIGLMNIVYPFCRKTPIHCQISQLSLSLYLMTQCQIKLNHPVASLSGTLDFVQEARRRGDIHRRKRTLSQLILTFVERIILRYIISRNSEQDSC